MAQDQPSKEPIETSDASFSDPSILAYRSRKNVDEDDETSAFTSASVRASVFLGVAFIVTATALIVALFDLPWFYPTLICIALIYYAHENFLCVREAQRDSDLRS